MGADEKVSVPGEASSGLKEDPEKKRRDPEDRPTDCPEDVREKMLDKTLADTFPTSDPLSTIPDPCADDPEAA
jgi:hypothetical protein